MYNKIKKIHLVGIGGIGVSGIAELLHRHGYSVSGSDNRRSETVQRLEGLGIQIFLGHHESHVEQAELVVYSSAVDPQNPELVAAEKKQIPVIRRAEMLAELMRLKHGIAIAGAHGKTTTTSMLATTMIAADQDPTVVVGGRMDNFGGTNARLGNDSFMLVEADESDGSFNRLTPSIAVVTNMDREHMDYYGNMRNLRSAFVSFVNKVPFYGLVILNGDDPHLKLIARRVTRRLKTYGFGKNNAYRLADYRITDQGCESRIETPLGEALLKLKVSGKHNALNALACLVIGDELGLSREKTLQGLAQYQGVQRRFQIRGQLGNCLFVDDYAHHPTEIKTVLATARERFPKGTIRALFQPHRYSRTEDLMDDFVAAFDDCDQLSILPIYAAGEEEISGVHSELLVELIRKRGHANVHYEQNAKAVLDTWIDQSQPGDVALTLGAGDLPNVYRQLF